MLYANVGGERPRSVYYKTGFDGQVLRRDEYDGSTAGEPHEVWYRFAGRQMGYTGNNGSEAGDYTQSIAQRTAAQDVWAFRNGAFSPTVHHDFDQSLSAINSYGQGAAGGSYLVRGGDTLAGIAAQLWGDSSLWYKLAEANGLGANAALREGQRLNVPAGIMRSTHNAATFNPYDPSAAIGDVRPSPKPTSARNNCGMFGQILLVAIAVTVATQGAIAAAVGSQVPGGALAGAAGPSEGPRCPSFCHGRREARGKRQRIDEGKMRRKSAAK